MGLGSDTGKISKIQHIDGQGNLLSKKTELCYHRLKRIYNFRTRISNRETDYRVRKSLNHASMKLKLTDDIRLWASYLYHKNIKQLSEEGYPPTSF